MIFISMRTILMLFLPNTQLYMVLYAGDLMTLDRQGIKKHYFVEGERFLTNCGSEGHPWADPKKALEGIDESELTMCKEFTDNIITYFAKHTPACYKFFDQKADISSELFDIADVCSYLLKEHNDLGSYYLHTDRLGSGSAVTDGRGEAVHVLGYMPYGETLLDLSQGYETPYQFTGYEKDQETGLHYAGARYYDSRLSIFLSVDRFAGKFPWQSPYCYASNNPIRYMDVNGDSAWRINNQWNTEYISKYHQYVPSQIQQYYNNGKKFTCEDLALSTLIDFASTNGLPVTIRNGKGIYDARSDNYTDIATFKNDVLTTTGARDLQNNNNTVSSDISRVRGGDIIVNRNNNNVGTHIQVVTASFYIDNTDFVNGVSIAQGNSGILNEVPGSSSILGAGDPNSSFYTGKPIERGWVDVNANVYFNNTKGTTTSNYSNAKNINVRRWNFSGF